jgi:heme-degrading monooxygenase HmoA
LANAGSPGLLVPAKITRLGYVPKRTTLVGCGWHGRAGAEKHALGEMGTQGACGASGATDCRGTGRRSGMHARVTTLEGSPERFEEGTRHVRERVLPQLQQMDGFKGFIALGDRRSGKLLGVALWESEEALRATEEAVSRVRSGAAEAAGGAVAGVEEYEVTVFEV